MMVFRWLSLFGGAREQNMSILISKLVIKYIIGLRCSFTITFTSINQNSNYSINNRGNEKRR